MLFKMNKDMSKLELVRALMNRDRMLQIIGGVAAVVSAGCLYKAGSYKALSLVTEDLMIDESTE